MEFVLMIMGCVLIAEAVVLDNLSKSNRFLILVIGLMVLFQPALS